MMGCDADFQRTNEQKCSFSETQKVKSNI
uniref:Uncharacterized protein n=1 Tax=Rhizophora mucronata TaxID=61149 RepID=A0A2P2JAX9_RHIMU